MGEWRNRLVASQAQETDHVLHSCWQRYLPVARLRLTQALTQYPLSAGPALALLGHSLGGSEKYSRYPPVLFYPTRWGGTPGARPAGAGVKNQDHGYVRTGSLCHHPGRLGMAGPGSRVAWHIPERGSRWLEPHGGRGRFPFLFKAE